MSITAEDAVKAARETLGTPYGSGAGELDCINLIKAIIRTAPGGAKKYTTAGTNALWRSAVSARKYRDLTYRQTTIDDPEAGMLAFKVSGTDVHHVGLVTGEGTVIHASSVHGEVVETALTEAEGWNALAIHRYIDPYVQEREETEADATGVYRVCAQGGLRQRETPGGRYMQMLPDGACICVEQIVTHEDLPWGRVTYRGHVGWISMQYTVRLGGDD